MEHITSTTDLKKAIQTLELDQAIKWELLKEQFYVTYETIKPANLILGTIKDIVTSPNLIDNIIGTVVGMGTGYLSKKIVVGTSSNIFKNLLGSVLQYGVTNAVSKHPEGIKNIGQFIFQKIFSKKEHASEEKMEVGRPKSEA